MRKPSTDDLSAVLPISKLRLGGALRHDDTGGAATEGTNGIAAVSRVANVGEVLPSEEKDKPLDASTTGSALSQKDQSQTCNASNEPGGDHTSSLDPKCESDPSSAVDDSTILCLPDDLGLGGPLSSSSEEAVASRVLGAQQLKTALNRKSIAADRGGDLQEPPGYGGINADELDGIQGDCKKEDGQKFYPGYDISAYDAPEMGHGHLNAVQNGSYEVSYETGDGIYYDVGVEYCGNGSHAGSFGGVSGSNGGRESYPGETSYSLYHAHGGGFSDVGRVSSNDETGDFFQVGDAALSTSPNGHAPAWYIPSGTSWESGTDGGIEYYNRPYKSNSSALGSICYEFARYGACSQGSSCRMVHGEWCETCQRYALHPTDEEIRQYHLAECEARHRRLAALQRSAFIECGICYERVLEKPIQSDRKFGLLACEHAFCLSCIRSWRQNTLGEADVQSAVRTCPICREPTHFITPSTVWPATAEEKEVIIAGYRAKLSSIDCRHFNFGEGTCPFGTSCMYRHMFHDGRLEEKELRRVAVDEGEVKVVQPVRLCDFIEVRRGRIRGRR